ncbi:MAG: hypothetical protein KZQ93_14550 [Candidatus Thiodiazotropha sp. (ex Monitilora ramsayi)]|nr:hypothetical protein [Candidatus Thiodiazotropha sp. (ex Monitilora ramsayi)]
MKSRLFKHTLLAGLISLSASSLAFADHMSIWGEGWANMPNEIHNLRIEYKDDNETFLSEIQYGAGAVTGGGSNSDNTEPGSGVSGTMNQGTMPVQIGGRARGRM